MSRTLHLSMSHSDVVDQCAKQSVGISAIEELVSGGVRLVTMSVDGAETMRAKLKTKIIKDEVTRTPVFLKAGRG